MKLRLISEGEHKDAFGTHKWKTYAQIPTNADLVRAMTDEELAEWFHRIQYDVSDYYCGGHSCEPTLPTGKESWLGWLKQEVSE